MGLPASRTVIKLPPAQEYEPFLVLWCSSKHLEWLKIAMRWGGGGSILILQPPVKIKNYSNNWFNIYKQKQLQKNSSLSAAWKPHNTKVSYHFSKKRDWGLLSYQWHWKLQWKHLQCSTASITKRGDRHRFLQAGQCWQLTIPGNRTTSKRGTQANPSLTTQSYSAEFLYIRKSPIFVQLSNFKK